MNLNALSKSTLIQIIEDLQLRPKAEMAAQDDKEAVCIRENKRLRELLGVKEETNLSLHNQLQESAKLGAVYMGAIKEHKKATMGNRGAEESVFIGNDRKLWQTLEDNK